MKTPRALLWLRAEPKAFEERTLVTPTVAQALVEAGYDVVIEKCPQRAFAIESYEAAGCKVVANASWKQAPSDAIVLGLKELDASLGPFTHRHVHFAHVYKSQRGWQAVMEAFEQGGGELYDLEYLVDGSGRRIAAFGYWAGFIGAALAVLALASPSLRALKAWPNSASLVADVQAALASLERVPAVLVIGALGRSGQGAIALCQACNISATPWDQEETRSGGPFDELLQHEILVNCVFIDKALPSFTDMHHLQSGERRLSVIADVSCDPDGAYNPLPVYSAATTLSEPVSRLIEASARAPALDLIAIDHLPSLLPTESSDDFSEQMRPHLLQIDRLDEGAWVRGLAVYKSKLGELRDEE